MAGTSDQRTEKPTARRLQKARDKGQIARSKEVPAAFVLLGGIVFLYFSGQSLVGSLTLQLRESLRLELPTELTPHYLQGLFVDMAMRIALSLAPFLALIFILGVTANVVQGGLAFSLHPLRFHFEKLNPKNGLTRIFSKNGLVELLKNVLLMVVVSIISYQVVIEYLPLYPRLVLMDARQLSYWIVTIGYQVLLRVAIFLLVVSFADYAFQKYRYLKGLRMTKQEVREEMKDAEGNPLTKGRVRRIQREMSQKRMMAEIPNADVVITNPTHFAVALSYKMDSMEAPKVVAKGVGFLALKIKELAQQHDVPLVENKPLAQALYKTVEIGAYIPADLYKAVAEILAFIYKARSAWGR